MRLGKTLPTIRWAKGLQPRDAAFGLRALVVAPSGALGSWARELAGDGSEDVVLLCGTRKRRLALLAEDHHWYLLNKEGWLSLPEVGGRSPCPGCKMRGTLPGETAITVVHCKREPYDVLIDRTTRWGNPYRLGRDGPRAVVIKKHRELLSTRTDLLADLHELQGKRLGCWCAPMDCHGDNLRDALQAQLPRRRCPTCHGEGHVPMEGEPPQWDVVVADESTFIKNPQAKVTRFFLNHVGRDAHRCILSGMPCPESLLELWCQLAWLDGEAFGCRSYWSFRARYFQPDDDWKPRPEATVLVDRVLGMRTMRLTRKDVGLDRHQVRERREVALPPALRKVYRRAERDFELETRTGVVSTIFATARWQWLRQMCGGFVDGELVWDGKIKELVYLLRGELSTEPVVVWFAYNTEIDAAQEALKKIGVTCRIMNGNVPQFQRHTDRDDFEAGRFRVFLIQQAVDTRGIDLSAASVAVYYSSHASGEMRTQSEDRILDVGKEGPLLYLDLVVPNTVDEDVAVLLEGKTWRSKVRLAGAVRERMVARIRGRG
jgi:hypothetical protein